MRRPMFHFTPKRIEVHVCICFVAYKVYKELKTTGFDLSVDKALNIAKTITTVRIKLIQSGQTMDRTMLLTEKHKLIKHLFEDWFWDRVSQ